MRKLFFGLAAGLLTLVGLVGSPSAALADPGHGHHDGRHSWHSGGWEHHHDYGRPAYRPYYPNGYYAPYPRYYAAPVVPGYYAAPGVGFGYCGPNVGFSVGY